MEIKKRNATHRPEYLEMLKRLRQARKDAGLRQVDVAAALGRYQSYVNKIETGERRRRRDEHSRAQLVVAASTDDGAGSDRMKVGGQKRVVVPPGSQCRTLAVKFFHSEIPIALFNLLKRCDTRDLEGNATYLSPVTILLSGR